MARLQRTLRRVAQALRVGDSMSRQLRGDDDHRMLVLVLAARIHLLRLLRHLRIPLRLAILCILIVLLVRHYRRVSTRVSIRWRPSSLPQSSRALAMCQGSADSMRCAFHFPQILDVAQVWRLPRRLKILDFFKVDFAFQIFPQQRHREIMAPKPRSGPSKGGNKRSSKPSSSSGSASKKKSSAPKPNPSQHKPGPRTTLLKNTKRKPPHLRYTEKELKVPQLNGIRPTGLQKLPNQKKGKKFVDDGDGMKTIMAMVMAEKEGDVESKMMRARQLEEVRAARKAEMEERAEGKKAGFEGRKADIKQSKKRRRGDNSTRDDGDAGTTERVVYKPRKRVSFG